MAEKLEAHRVEKVEHFKQLKLVVFGATGATGTELVKQGLELGHDITAVVRTPEKFTLSDEKLKVVKGDAYHSDTFEAELDGKDAVVSCLGSTALGPFATTTLYSDTVKIFVEAMKRHSVKRFVAVTSSCSKKEPTNPLYVEWFLRPFIFGGCMSDIAIMEDYLASTDPTEINYTVVRPPRLTNAPGTGNYKVKEAQFCHENWGGIPRAHVAHFMLAALQTDRYDRKGMAIAIDNA